MLVLYQDYINFFLNCDYFVLKNLIDGRSVTIEQLKKVGLIYF
jgi:hypothetical protein